MHNIEGDIRNCIEIANGDYNLSHLDEPMLKYYNKLVVKAKAYDRINVIHDKNVNEMSISDTECIEMIGNELERADDER